jgi:hypothetical protein
MIPHTHVEVAEVLCHLAGRTNAPSSMGSQLDRLATQSEAKNHGPGWGTHSKPTRPTPKDPEGPILRDGAAFRVIHGLGCIRTADLDVPALVALSQGSSEGLGRIVIRTLRAFQEALAAPSDEDIERATKRADKTTSRKGEPPDEYVARRAEVFQRAVAEYRAPRGLDAVQRLFGLKESSQAAELYGDALLVLSMYVQSFNRRKKAA